MCKTAIAVAIFLPLFAFLAPQACGYSGGTGSAASPFQIANTADLMQLAGDTANYDMQFILTADLNLAGLGDNPDGSFSTAVIAWDTNAATTAFEGTEFSGVFNGNGHTISNLTIDTKGVNKCYLGLFGMLDMLAQVKNLELQNVTIIATSRSDNVGALVGKSYYYADITRCKTSGSISGGYYVGGLCGYNNGNVVECKTTAAVASNQYAGGVCGNNQGEIERCIATGDVTGTSHTVGALCGQNYYGTIQDCYALGATSESIGSVSAFCATNYGFIRKCYATRVAICNKNWGAITDCYWDSDVSQIDVGSGGVPASTSNMKKASTFKGWNDGKWTIFENSSYPYLAWEAVGGTAITTGYPAAAYPGNGVSVPFEISSPAHLVSMSQRTCDWNKDFVLTSDVDMNATVYIPVADFTGTFDGQGHVIANLTIDGSVTRNQQQIALFGYLGAEAAIHNLRMENVTLTGQELIGAIAGMNDGATIMNCSATGSASGNISGGLCGYNREDIIDCWADVDVNGFDHSGGLCGWNIGNIYTSFAAGHVSGNYYVGGLCGTNSGILENCFAQGNVMLTGTWGDDAGGLCGINWKTIRFCYAANSVNGSIGARGGICGNNFSSIAVIENCFWDTETQTGTTTLGVADNPNGGTITNVFGKTTAEMQTQSTYTDYGWNLAGTPPVWKMPTGGYPQLTWQNRKVDLEEFQLLSRFWQMTGCSSGQPCSAADWYVDGQIDFSDLMQLAESWLSGDMHIVYDATSFEENFETRDFSRYPWQHSGNASWVVSSTLPYEGSWCAKSGVITHNQSSTLQVEIDVVGRNTISFYKKVSSEQNFDYLRFYIDDVLQGSWSGTVAWSQVSYPITAGVHTFKWIYSKDGSVSSGSDGVWIDLVKLE